ncbi:SGNH/GDSL hydrolase family protein [Methylobacterium phyllosphaerae]
MAEPETDQERSARRKRFLDMFPYFSPDSRYPAPYTQFAGKPGKQVAKNGWSYDALGYRNAVHADARPASETLRVFVVGDSTMVEGHTIADTVPGLLEAALRRTHGAGARVYNFGAISACLNQMTALITMRLADLQPDVILVVGGATDIFQPWSFDPRPGIPFNHFVTECLAEYLFDPNPSVMEAAEFSYEDMQEEIFNRLHNLRTLLQWQSEPWEWEVVRQFELSAKRLARLSRGVDAPIRFILQPSVIRKTILVGAEQKAASKDFLKYLDQQYGRFERVLRDLAESPLIRPGFAVRDMGRVFENEQREIFTDIVHYTVEGRERVAEALAVEVTEALGTTAAGADQVV